MESLEGRLGLPPGLLRMELMIETPQALLNIPRLAAAGAGRISAAHLGAYDFTASLNVSGAHQRLTHPACDFARLMMETALADTGIRISDGATNLMPVPPRAAIHNAWKVHYENIRPALDFGIYQGWTFIPPNFRHVTRRSTRSFWRGWRRLRSGFITSSRMPRGPRWPTASSTTLLPARDCSTSSCARSTPAQSPGKRRCRGRA
ncbi:MAG: aldolase/citrate lyase family protein [Acidobacteria bacterium]|nr:aldolase/citrate lyase family protein [Acidobacteriota bacterium]